jgi:hypothetical protein
MRKHAFSRRVPGPTKTDLRKGKFTRPHGMSRAPGQAHEDAAQRFLLSENVRVASTGKNDVAKGTATAPRGKARES